MARVADVYPILAFLAGALPGGDSPPWIVQGTYMGDEQTTVGAHGEQSTPPLGMGGVLRSNLANEEFIQWLPETMVQFAEQTGAGGVPAGGGSGPTFEASAPLAVPAGGGSGPLLKPARHSPTPWPSREKRDASHRGRAL